MQKVVDYQLLQGGSTQTLTKVVTDAMQEGWVPSGTVVAFDGMLVQAMVKFEG